MYDELSTQSADYQARRSFVEPPQTSQDPTLEFADMVSDVMVISSRSVEAQDPLLLRFNGRLKMDSSDAYDMLDAQLEPRKYRAHFIRGEQTPHVILIAQGRFAPGERPWWPNLLLFLLTIISTMMAGATIDGVLTEFNDLFSPKILQGLPYAISVLLILGAHELGHYFAARYHNVSVTLPYFIPLPIIGLFGTMGAFIQLREPMKNRNQLFDVGVAGPLAGLVFAIPILLIGVATAEVSALPTEADCAEGEICSYMLEGNSLVYATTKYIMHGEWLPTDTRDMTLNQLAFAGWTGLFVTGLNLLPVGQLDGGHVLYTLIGRTAKLLYYPAMALMIALTFYNNAWFLWVILLLIFGRMHAVPLDDITPLGPVRRTIGIITLVIFLLIFVPNPIQIITIG